MKNKKIIVTGGLGFIGSHLIESLYENNNTVIIDDQSTGHIQNIKDFNSSKIDINLDDITQINLENIFEGADYIFHMAAMTSVTQSVIDPIRCNDINITGTLKVLEAARKCEVKKVIFSSSAAVYGETESLPINENIPFNPLSPYAVSKITGELYCDIYSEIYGLPTVSLRYFNVFGPRQDPRSDYASVIPIFVDKIFKNETPVIYGDGEQTRDFVHVKKVVEANILSAKSHKTGVFNIGQGKNIPINQLLKIVQNVIGKDIKSRYEELRAGEIKHSLADISKAIAIGYIPKNGFREELEETIEWFKSKKSES
ncbi:MAG: NAD-dependent epimerase/dehydratase family protein [Methanobacterium sp.]|nr:NAD-dependent epimerase/dehydratase family protein [Methanobacterium sp.]